MGTLGVALGLSALLNRYRYRAGSAVAAGGITLAVALLISVVGQE
jgi:hypothetical protein